MSKFLSVLGSDDGNDTSNQMGQEDFVLISYRTHVCFVIKMDYSTEC